MFDASFIANPYPTYQGLRSAPLHWTEFYGGTWLVSRYADVYQALNDPRLSNKRSHSLTAQFSEQDQAEFTQFNELAEKWAFFLEPPRHTHLRKILLKGFSPYLLKTLQPRIQLLLDQLLDEFIDTVHAEGVADFMSIVAHPLPAIVIAEMLGVDPDDRNQFIEWTERLALFLGSTVSTLEVARQAQDAILHLNDYFANIINERRKRLQASPELADSDLISLLLSVEDEGEGLTPEDVLAQCAMLIVAGHETTRNLLGNGLWTLLNHPEHLHWLKQNPEQLRDGLKELLRYESPIQFTVRVVTEDFSWHGQDIQKGQFLILLIGSANRDPNQFTEPDRLDFTRQNLNGHLAFGQGIHACIGASLAYLEGEMTLRAIFQRLPKLALMSTEPDWANNFAFRGLNKLLLSFSN